MPIYEYRCNDCNKKFEYLVIGKDGPDACPSCRSKKVSRVMSACGFLSKGKSGETVSKSAGSSCSGCSSGNCASCG
ncbi:MAG: FmdB family transcriptional regulator [Desulfobacterales bacterium CG23_combo_of_CG06-09_8_20_14_all_52_9]|nr:MAG: FmdB family transcriptional regulator [Desulfobacterales bacterium CG23_combo_of_CG06-09_8_20_14_all_52_9]